MAAGERKLRRREIAFRPDKHQYALGKVSMFARVISEDSFQMLRTRLKRADQVQIECRRGRKKLAEPAWRVNARQPILPALLGCLDRNLLPFRLFLRGAFQIELYDRAIGNDWRNLGCPDLDRLLHDQLHVFSLWNRLPENDSTAQRRGFRLV